MSTAIDVAIVLIVAFSAWRGFKNGFIRGVFGILAIIIALYGANLVAKAYSGEFTGMLEPFVGGIVDSSVADVLYSDEAEGENMIDDGQTEDSQSGISDETDKTSVYDICYKTMRNIGVSEEASKRIAEKVAGELDTVSQQLASNLTEKLSAALAYIAVFGISFILIAIIFAVIGNILNLAFAIPGIETVDRLIGVVFGLFKGILIVFAIGVIVRYIGLVSSETIENTKILNYLVNENPIANILGI